MTNKTMQIGEKNVCAFMGAQVSQSRCFYDFNGAYQYIDSLSPENLYNVSHSTINNWPWMDTPNHLVHNTVSEYNTGVTYNIISLQCTDENKVIEFSSKDAHYYCVDDASYFPSMTIEEANEILGASLLVLATVWGIVMLKKLILPKKFT